MVVVVIINGHDVNAGGEGSGDGHIEVIIVIAGVTSTTQVVGLSTLGVVVALSLLTLGVVVVVSTTLMVGGRIDDNIGGDGSRVVNVGGGCLVVIVVGGGHLIIIVIEGGGHIIDIGGGGCIIVDAGGGGGGHLSCRQRWWWLHHC